MERLQFRFIIAALILLSLTTSATINAAPVKFNQVVQVINTKPGKAENGSFAQLRLSGEITVFPNDENDKDKKKSSTPPRQDERVITETSVEIIEEDVCDCEDVVVRGGGFPYWTLGFAAIPFLFLIPRDNDKTPTPTMTPTMTPTPPESPTPTPTPPNSPTPTPTPTPPGSPTPTPTPPETPTPTPTPPNSPTPTPPPPMMTPTPPPEPVPEPMTILLFGTGLAGIGLAARKKFGKKRKQEETED